MLPYKTLSDLELGGKTVLVRADLNVPLKKDGSISDDHRIKMFKPTLDYLVEQGAKVVVISHLGRPEGPDDLAFSFRPIANQLSKLLDKNISLAPDCVGPEVEALVSKLNPGGVLLLENLRFHKGEKSCDPEFCSLLARHGDVYINDAFATAHRCHSSTFGVVKDFEESAIGLLMEKELSFFSQAFESPQKPLTIVIGGAKVSSKLKALNNIADKADKIIIGGAMANTFLAAQGLQMGRSLVERELFSAVQQLMVKLTQRDCPLYLPVDFVVGAGLNSKRNSKPAPLFEVPPQLMALDIGPATSTLYREVLDNAGTIVWNGPMGAFENEDYAEGTHAITEAIASSTALTLIGGGDTDAAIHQMELGHKFDYISTGGGAFLSLLEGSDLAALEPLKR